MNIFGFTFVDSMASLFIYIGYGVFFGLFIGIFRFLLLTFFERESA